MNSVQLDRFRNEGWLRGRSVFVEAIWIFLSLLLVRSPIPGSAHRRILLRLFGADIGRGAVIKPSVRIKFPWRLKIGDHSWVGEGVWIDNLDNVSIGSNACISQNAYLCTGSHDWSSPAFDLITKPIYVGDGAWISANTTVGPGVTIGVGSVLSLGSVATKDLEPWWIYAGNPTQKIKTRVIR